MRVAIVGSRSQTDAAYIKKTFNFMIHTFITPFTSVKKTPLTILSGGAKGVDSIAQEWASEQGHDFILFKPYHLLDKRVTYEPKYFFVRNKQMVDNSDAVVVLWDEESNGCFDAARYAHKINKPLFLFSTKQDRSILIDDFI
jgi:predicted Rossmann-fold nucleotide-binding protein